MPERGSPHRRMELLSREERLTYETRPFQEHWYGLVAARLRSGDSVLDVGAGAGYGLDIMRERCALAVGIDPAPLRDEVWPLDVGAFSAGSFDVVTVVDVVEHVDEPYLLLREAVMVARQAVFLSTPNWNRSRLENEFHAREFTPAEFWEYVSVAGLTLKKEVDWFESDDPPPVPVRVEDISACRARNMAAWIWTGPRETFPEGR